MTVDAELSSSWKVVKPNYVKVLLSTPVSLIFMAFVIMGYILIQFWQFWFIDEYVTKPVLVDSITGSTNITNPKNVTLVMPDVDLTTYLKD